ncbi:tetrahydrofolate dehydrogenase/cyclohydrolase catalytic domain-containing protein [Paenibacillus sp. GD4]|uniref:bifunctional 5,10-methylenetetrahydrofolate dehydrogenase/5,10-methenyltetrahydrofolate cyclohydrolase n=1 Tax=Paenibacillus sp. GD4 TaxID=3068890 RepID=UPI00279652A1|nr:tetrahydrofolate dehydrogenase/cyclohydrolase catalytic domain-containing protein [Paenibacillus sp. GD4]MDQ1912103.1 tetrahydrofolate dehydrogenase/cyclohydrolase catalytic domain-containing protein [Paenibacillus sp. GD4]
MKKTLILDGACVAQSVKEKLAQRIQSLALQGITPCLATILVGDDPASETYVKMKGNACRRLGIHSRRIHLDRSITTNELITIINELNHDDQVHGILLQHPVPHHLDERAAFEAIAIEKDVDGVTMAGFARSAFGLAGFPCCTPAAMMEIMDYYKLPMEGKHAVVIGRSPILGKPASLMLLNRNATVTVCHSKTKDLDRIVQLADIVVAAVGKPRFVQGSWIKEGAVVLDAGYNPGNIGDVDYEACLKKASAITPVPAGVGPVTIAMLLKHTVEAAEKRLELVK